MTAKTARRQLNRNVWKWTAFGRCRYARKKMIPFLNRLRRTCDPASSRVLMRFVNFGI